MASTPSVTGASETKGANAPVFKSSVDPGALLSEATKLREGLSNKKAPWNSPNRSKLESEQARLIAALATLDREIKASVDSLLGGEYKTLVEARNGLRETHDPNLKALVAAYKTSAEVAKSLGEVAKLLGVHAEPDPVPRLGARLMTRDLAAQAIGSAIGAHSGPAAPASENEKDKDKDKDKKPNIFVPHTVNGRKLGALIRELWNSDSDSSKK